MITCSAALKRHLASANQTTCTLWKVTQQNGTVVGFTDLDRDIVSGGVTYHANVGYTRTDIATSGALNVDNLEVHGPLAAPSLTEPDLAAGIWDFATIKLSLINWGDFFIRNPITSITRSGGTATATVGSTALLRSGDTLLMGGADQGSYNVSATITVTNPTHFTFPVSGSPATPATGTLYYQTQMGELIYRVGNLGESTVERNNFKAELRGLAQAYTRVIGQLTSPTCRYLLGDSRCTVDLTPFTVTSTLTGVGSDNRTLFDTARTEPGPTGGVAITAITQANPGHVTVMTPLTIPSGSPITISGVGGMQNVNVVTVANNIASDGLSFDLSVNTTSFPAYTSGGTVTPLGANSGYFDNGVITFTSGLNNGLAMEVQSYVPGQITLELPMPYQCAIGDAYSMHAGCDYSFPTCRDRFANAVNFGGENVVPGPDKIMQMGKQ